MKKILDHLHVHSKFNDPIKKLLRAPLNQSVREVTGTPVHQCSKVTIVLTKEVYLTQKFWNAIFIYSLLLLCCLNFVSILRFAYKIQNTNIFADPDNVKSLLLDCNDSEIKIITISNSWFYIFTRYMKFFHDDYSSQIRWDVTVL